VALAAKTEPIHTAEELVEDARRAGFQVTVRLVTDWVELGLLDRPDKRPLGRGRGSAKGVWSQPQREMFVALLDRRATVTRVAGLANFPVWTWLVYGDDFVPLRQARRALKTWCGRHRGNRGLSQAEAGRMARNFLESIVRDDTRPRDRAELRRFVVNSLTTMTLDTERFRDLVARVLDPAGTGRVIGPAQAPLTTDVVVTGVESRFLAMMRLDELTKAQFEQARLVYVITKQLYFAEWSELASAPEGDRVHPQPTLEREVNQACFDLLTILGMNVLQPEGADRFVQLGLEKGILGLE